MSLYSWRLSWTYYHFLYVCYYTFLIGVLKKPTQFIRYKNLVCHGGKEHFLWCSQSKASRLYITARRMVNLTEGANVTVMKTLLSASIRIEIIAIAVANFFSPSRHLWATFWSCLLFVKWFLFIRRQNCYFSAWQSLILALVSFPSHSWPPWCSWLIILTSKFWISCFPIYSRLYPLLFVEYRFLHQLPWVWTDFSPCFWGWGTDTL